MDRVAQTNPLETSKSFFRTRAFGLLLVWALLVSAAIGTYMLTRGLEGRGDQTASVYSSLSGSKEISLYRDRAEPSAMSASLGEEIAFVVKDESLHNMAQERESRGDARLESGEFGKDESYSLVFSRKGSYSFYDRLNQDIRVTITVR